MKRLAGGVLLSGVALLLVTACSPIGKMTHDMDKAVLNASTRTDHETLAVHYEQEAKALQAKAMEHDKMAESYSKPGYAASSKANLPQHCSQLAARYREAARENLQLAKGHRELAAAAPR